MPIFCAVYLIALASFILWEYLGVIYNTNLYQFSRIGALVCLPIAWLVYLIRHWGWFPLGFVEEKLLFELSHVYYLAIIPYHCLLQGPRAAKYHLH